MVTYKRPNTIGQRITNFKTIAFTTHDTDAIGSSAPCGRCALCGNHGKYNKSMVPTINTLKTGNKTIQLTQKLTCKNFGIYVATCILCNAQYVGQTVNKFSVRWAAHRSTWNNFNLEQEGDQVALLRHFATFHSIKDEPNIYDCFTVTLVEQPRHDTLDACEDKWFHKIGATINIQNTILPKFK